MSCTPALLTGIILKNGAKPSQSNYITKYYDQFAWIQKAGDVSMKIPRLGQEEGDRAQTQFSQDGMTLMSAKFSL